MAGPGVAGPALGPVCLDVGLAVVLPVVIHFVPYLGEVARRCLCCGGSCSAWMRTMGRSDTAGGKSSGRHARRAPSSGEKADEHFPTLLEPKFSQSFERGLAILVCYSGEQPVMGIADIADHLGMSRATTHRYVITLVALGYLEQVEDRKYRLGLRVTDIGTVALENAGLLGPARPCLKGLRERTSCTVSLGALVGREVLCLAQVRSPDRTWVPETRPGVHLPAYCTAMGKVLLASLPEDEQHELVASLRLTKRGPNTITTAEVLLEELAQVRGIAVEDEEFAEGHFSIASSIYDKTGVVAAVGVTAGSRMTQEEMFETFGPDVLDIAHQITTRLHDSKNDA